VALPPLATVKPLTVPSTMSLPPLLIVGLLAVPPDETIAVPLPTTRMPCAVWPDNTSSVPPLDTLTVPPLDTFTPLTVP
jgi:hypothetical protein